MARAFPPRLEPSFSDLGAEVIKVESPEGDVTRRRGPFPRNQADQEKSGLFIYLNTNKRGVVADLRTDAGRKVLHNLRGDRSSSGIVRNLPFRKPEHHPECILAIDHKRTRIFSNSLSLGPQMLRGAPL